MSNDIIKPKDDQFHEVHPRLQEAHFGHIDGTHPCDRASVRASKIYWLPGLHVM